MFNDKIGFILNLDREDSIRYLQLDNKLYNDLGPDYLEKAEPMAKKIYDRLKVLRSEGKTDTIEAIHLYGMYDGVKQYFLTRQLAQR